MTDMLVHLQYHAAIPVAHFDHQFYMHLCCEACLACLACLACEIIM